MEKTKIIDREKKKISKESDRLLGDKNATVKSVSSKSGEKISKTEGRVSKTRVDKDAPQTKVGSDKTKKTNLVENKDISKSNSTKTRDVKSNNSTSSKIRLETRQNVKENTFIEKPRIKLSKEEGSVSSNRNIVKRKEKVLDSVRNQDASISKRHSIVRTASVSKQSSVDKKDGSVVKMKNKDSVNSIVKDKNNVKIKNQLSDTQTTSISKQSSIVKGDKNILKRKSNVLDTPTNITVQSPANSKQNSFIDEKKVSKQSNAKHKIRVSDIQTDQSPHISKQKSIIKEDRNAVKRKNRVLDTTTNITVQSPPVSKQNSFVDESKQNSFVDKNNSKHKSKIVDTLNQSPPISKQNSLEEKSSKQNSIDSASPIEEAPSTSKPKRTRTKTQTLDTSEIKILKNISYTIDLDNPDADISLTNYPNDNQEENYEYEDDFESYESDFESCSSSSSSSSSNEEEPTQNLSRRTSNESTSNDESKSKMGSEEEKKLDSGNFDLRTKQSFNSPMSTLSDINETENVLDEGFVEHDKKKVVKKVSKRGQEILSKLRLDEMTFQLFEMQPLTYNEYMCVYGNQNCIQSSTQTKDDNMCVDIQTDEVLIENKWTQHPIEYTKYFEDNKICYKTLCTGSDTYSKVDVNQEPLVNFQELNDFLLNAGKQMLINMEEQIEPKLKHNKDKSVFSDGYYKMDQKFDFLKRSNVISMSFDSNTNLFAAAFKNSRRSSKDLGDGDLKVIEPISESYVCVWHIQDASYPKFILSSTALIRVIEFIEDNVIIAGCRNGSILCWDLTEGSLKYDETINCIVRLPSQIIIEEENTDRGCITQMCLMNKTDYDINVQVCILHQYGYISIWTLLKNQFDSKINLSKDPGVNLTSKIRLIRSHVLKIEAMKMNQYDRMYENNIVIGRNQSAELNFNLEYDNMCLDSTEARLVYVFPNNSNYIIGCGVSWTDKFRYYSLEGDTSLSLTSNPYHQPWFAVMCTENIYIFRKFHQKPVIKLYVPLNTNLIINPSNCFIKYSPSMPGMLFAIKGSSIMVFDMMKQELLCQEEMKDVVVDVKIFRRAERDYLIISYKNRIEVHKISKRYRTDASIEIVKSSKELSEFMHLF